MNTTIGQLFLKELEAEEVATRKCLERIPESLYSYKPHEKSMIMGNLVAVVAEIPKWLATIAEVGEINFTTWKKYDLTTTEKVVAYFDDNMKMAKEALKKVADDTLEKERFYLKFGEKVLMEDTREGSISSSLNHWVHHRGQMTVYMRMNNIPVPSLYGPSADEDTFKDK